MERTVSLLEPRRHGRLGLPNQHIVREYLPALSEKARRVDRIRYNPVAGSSHKKNQVVPETIRGISLIDPRSPEAYINSFSKKEVSNA